MERIAPVQIQLMRARPPYWACTSRLVSVFLFISLDLIFPFASLELWRKRLDSLPVSTMWQ